MRRFEQLRRRLLEARERDGRRKRQTEFGNSKLRTALFVQFNKDRARRAVEAAVYEGDYDAVLRAVDAGGSANHVTRRGFTLLCTLCRAGKAEHVAALIALGADPNLPSPRDGVTPLVLAARLRDVRLMGAILEAGKDRGLDLNRPAVLDRDRHEGATALMVLAAYGAVAAPLMVRMLDAGAAPDAVTWRGRTALSFACRFRRLATARLLLEEGALPTHMDKGGFTPVDWLRCAVLERVRAADGQGAGSRAAALLAGRLTEEEILNGSLSTLGQEARTDRDRALQRQSRVVFAPDTADKEELCGNCHELPARFKSLNTNTRLCQRCVLWLHKQPGMRHHRIKPLVPSQSAKGLRVRRVEEEAVGAAFLGGGLMGGRAAGSTLLESLRLGRALVAGMRAATDVAERDRRAKAEASRAAAAAEGSENLTALERVARARAAREAAQRQAKEEATGGSLIDRMRKARTDAKRAAAAETHSLDNDRRQLAFLEREDLLDEGDPALAEMRARVAAGEPRRAEALRRAKEVELDAVSRLVNPMEGGRGAAKGGFVRPGSRAWLAMAQWGRAEELVASAKLAGRGGDGQQAGEEDDDSVGGAEGDGDGDEGVDGDGDGPPTSVEAAAASVREQAEEAKRKRRREVLVASGVPLDRLADADDTGLLRAARRGGAGDVGARADQATTAAAHGYSGAVVLAAGEHPSGPRTDMLTGVSNLPGALAGAYGGRDGTGPRLTDEQRDREAVARYSRALALIGANGKEEAHGGRPGESLLDPMRGHGQAKAAAARAAATDSVFEAAGLDPHGVGANRNAKREQQLRKAALAQRRAAREAAKRRAQEAARQRVQAMHRDPPELDLAIFFSKHKRFGEAEKVVRGVMAEQVRVLGVADRAVALTFAVSCLVSREQGRAAESERSLEQAKDILAAFGAHPASSDAVRVAIEEGKVIRAAGRSSEEVAHLRGRIQAAHRVQTVRANGKAAVLARLHSGKASSHSDHEALVEAERAARAEVDGVTEVIPQPEVDKGLEQLRQALQAARESFERECMLDEDDIEQKRVAKASKRARRASVTAQRDMQWRIRRGSVSVQRGQAQRKVKEAGAAAARRARASVFEAKGDGTNEEEASDEELADGAGEAGRTYQVRLRPSREELEALVEEPRWRELLRKHMKGEGCEGEMDFLVAAAAFRERALAAAAGGGMPSSVGEEASRLNQRYIASGSLSTVPVGMRRRVREELETGANPDTFDEVLRVVRVSIVRGPLRRFWVSKRGLRYRAERALSIGLPAWTLEQVSKLAAPSKAELVARLQSWCRGVVAQIKFGLMLRAARLQAEEEGRAEPGTTLAIAARAAEARDTRRQARRARLRRRRGLPSQEEEATDAAESAAAAGRPAWMPQSTSVDGDDLDGAGENAARAPSEAAEGDAAGFGAGGFGPEATARAQAEAAGGPPADAASPAGPEQGDHDAHPSHQSAGHYDEAGNWVDTPSGYYDEAGNWVDTSTGYYDQAGNWVDLTQGYYDEAGNWIDPAAQALGYYDEAGNWVDTSGQQAAGYYDEAGNWVDTPSGYYDEAGNWVDTSTGYYDQAGNWVAMDPHSAGYYDESGAWVGAQSGDAAHDPSQLRPDVVSVDEYGYQHTATGYYDPSGVFFPYEEAGEAAAGASAQADGGMPADGTEWGGLGGAVQYDEQWGYHDDGGYWDAENQYVPWPTSGADASTGGSEAQGEAGEAKPAAETTAGHSDAEQASPDSERGGEVAPDSATTGAPSSAEEPTPADADPAAQHGAAGANPSEA
ncbi:hypothetical protein FNF31_06103 [Cafeteria roenbergensis]|uniref:RGS domain-containing protein n=1 Tax=Cafeteria roenbergensis TaxID=33653 RepID=A0A5A8CSB0_CAFRO|nr:hypothetical protein FNF31_06103 [Cafeteria roenbergensis]